MAKYSDGNEARYAGGELMQQHDVVICIDASDSCVLQPWKEYTALRDYGENIGLAGEGMSNWNAKRFKLIRRAPSPEPEQPKVNGVYASGEVPEVGDLVECIEEHGHHTVNSRFTVESFNCAGNIVSIGSGHGTAPRRFKLIHRKEQPAVNHEQSPPLVVWPEEKKLTWPDLEPGEIFAFDLNGYRDRVYVRCVEGYSLWMDPIGGGRIPNALKIENCSSTYHVRRLKQTVAPQFTVI